MFHDEPSAQDVPETPAPPLRSLYFYMTDECNQRCIHCWIDPVLEGRSRSPRVGFDDYCRLIDAALPLGLKVVKLTGGEPLLREETLPILRYVSRVGVESMLETNAMLVGPHEAEMFLENRVSVGLSLDASDPVAHDRRRGLPGAFERTWRALEIMAGLGIPLTVVAAISRSNRQEIARILRRLGRLDRQGPLQLKINPILALGRARKMARNGETLEAEDLQDLVREICDELLAEAQALGIRLILQVELAYFPIDNLAQGAGRAGVYHCGFLNLLSVLADGSLTFCGIGYQQPDLIMGNIRSGYDLASLWSEHPVLRSVRSTVQRALEGVCGDCLFHPLCLGGCRASALATGGSIAASPPNCQALYDAGLFPVSRLREPAASRYAASLRAAS